MAAGLAACLSACGGLADGLAPGKKGSPAPARVALTASIAAAVGGGTDVVALAVLAKYVRRDGSAPALGAQTLTLGARASQALPIPVDLAACLGDPERDALNAQDRSCPVVLQVELLVNGASVDRQVIGPLRLSPGSTTNVAQPVSLYEISSIDITSPAGPVVSPAAPYAVVLGESPRLGALVRDRAGQVVPDRNVAWSTDAPGVVSIASATGAVSTVALGDARITASIGNVTRSIQLRVLRPPAALTVVAGSGKGGSGTVRSTPPGIMCRIAGSTASGSCAFTFPGDASVSLVAVADAGSLGDGLGDACAREGVDATCVLTMDRAQRVSASFTALRRIALQGSSGDGRGRVTAEGGLDFDCLVTGAEVSGTCALEVPEGTRVTLRASPEAAASGTLPQVFAGWGGECASATGPMCTLSAAGGALNATARFLDGRRLNVTLGGSGGGRVSATEGIACTIANGSVVGACSLGAAFGTIVTLTALPDARSTFAGWSGDCAGAGICRVSLAEARSVAATFNGLRRLSVVAGTGDGRGRISGSGVDCRIAGATASGVCEVEVAAGASVTLTASPDVDGATTQVFAGWGGACAAVSGVTCNVRVTGDESPVTARFYDEQRISVAVLGTGAGQVVAAAGITCVRSGGATSGVCERTAVFGTRVTLTAVADSQSVFTGWSGGCESQSGPSCVTTLTQARGISATFSAKLLVTLTLTVTGLAAGSLTVNGEQTCALATGQGTATCKFSFVDGTRVSISAVPAATARFTGFGDACSGIPSCVTVVAGAGVVVSGRFDPRQYVLTLLLSGVGTGSVTLDGAPFCTLSGATTCTRPLDYGTTVLLAGTPGAGTTLGGLGGDCGGTNPCRLLVTRDAQVSGVFSLAPVTLTALPYGTGAGTVTSTGALACELSGGVVSGKCTETLAYGATVTLRAVGSGVSTFSGWTGACAGQRGSTCTLTLTGNVSFGVEFAGSRD